MTLTTGYHRQVRPAARAVTAAEGLWTATIKKFTEARWMPPSIQMNEKEQRESIKQALAAVQGVGAMQKRNEAQYHRQVRPAAKGLWTGVIKKSSAGRESL